MSMTNDSENILARLKRETAEIHQELENKMPFAGEDFSLPEYQCLIVNFYNFYEKFEPQIERALKRYQIDFDYSRRLKTPKLALDLQNLETPLSSNFDSVENEPAIFNSREKVFGALYVVEGSTLGGQVIARILKRKFNFDESNGAAFFGGYGAETGAMWNAFRAAITEFAETSDNHEDIIVAATETFQRISKAVGER